MWYNLIEKLPPSNLKNAKPTGRWDPDVQKAKRLGIRYKSWNEIGRHWLANPGINRPYARFWSEAGNFYREIKELENKKDVKNILKLQNQALVNVRDSIREVFELDESYKIIFDSNGSVLCSTVAKLFKNKNPRYYSLTFSDQGRLVYAAIALEARTVTKFVSNFEQPMAIFEAPLPKKKINVKSPFPRSIKTIDIFNFDNTYKSDAKIIEEYEKEIKNKNIDFILLLHVSRTGRILPVEDLIKITRKIRPELFVFVDGAQAIGRMSYEKIKNIIKLADGYLIVGHKALGAAISAAFIINKNANEAINKKIKQAPFYNLKLFQFETPEQNIEILNRALEEGKQYYFISAPELLTLKVALKDNVQNFWHYQKEICFYKERLLKFLRNQSNIYLNVNRFYSVDDIVAFHLRTPTEAIELKNNLQELQPPITIGPLTENYAIRIGIEPKLPNLSLTMEYLEKSLTKILNFNQKSV
ncbi:MAG: aminotransferase class V-fold PLP-dependent enzyme [Candidatus Micrarchaeota archaeon]|nr:aminotransferase class V-fold PLP-dependent enzyme [Candidatus Micrarchaeota archaeon]